MQHIRLLEIQSSVLLLQVSLAGNFETKFKNESGTEVTVNRSADGKFAKKGEGGGRMLPSSPDAGGSSAVSPQGRGGLEIAVKSIGDFGKRAAKLPAQVQEQIRKTIFDSDFSRSMQTETQKIVQEVADVSVTKGFLLGQQIQSELAKKPFEEFGKAVSERMSSLNKLPAKADSFKDVATEFIKEAASSPAFAAGLSMGVAALWATASVQAFLAVPAAANPTIAAGLSVVGVLRGAVAAVLVSDAGKAIMLGAGINWNKEKERAVALLDRAESSLASAQKDVSKKIEEIHALRSQVAERVAEDIKARKKIFEKISQELNDRAGDVRENVALLQQVVLGGVSQAKLNLNLNTTTAREKLESIKDALSTGYKDSKSKVRENVAKFNKALSTELNALLTQSQQQRQEKIEKAAEIAEKIRLQVASYLPKESPIASN
ncbi:MAG: hypothetical protein HC786_23240 [Richelia sp. CSU_2_1]|nr:hypothetical protein [Richelia sp. CSU_2_1]